ncbi:hypothetical protein AA700_1306 [Acidiphilium acidophilum DSM 700]|nr:hypothetical protein AA700_1306 [Acidiphilium acidophilum DSM 700]
MKRTPDHLTLIGVGGVTSPLHHAYDNRITHWVVAPHVTPPPTPKYFDIE